MLIPSEHKKILPEFETPKWGNFWKQAANQKTNKEIVNFNHAVFVLGSDTEDPMELFHGESMINYVIPRLLEKKKKGETLKILDVGAGIATYSDVLRDKFRDNPFGVKIKIFSSGLSKTTAERYRRSLGMGKLNPNDIILQSITQMTDFPEFDLIIDTYGEFTSLQNEDEYKQKIYFVALFAKLKGYASLFPCFFKEIPAWLDALAREKGFRVVLKGRVLKIEENA